MEKKVYTEHHVYPLRGLGSDNECNRIRLTMDHHQGLHKTLDLKKLDTKLESFYKIHNVEIVRSLESTNTQYKLLSEFFTNYDKLSPTLQKIIAQKIRQIIIWHLRDREHLTQESYYKYSEQQVKSWRDKASAKDIQDLLMIDKMIASDLALHVRRRIKKILPNTEEIMTPHTKTTSNIHMVPLTLRGRHTPSNQLENIERDTHIHLVDVIGESINLGRRRRTARKYTNEKLIFGSNERKRWGDIQHAYFRHAEEILENEGHADLWVQYTDKMNSQMHEDAEKRKFLSGDSLTLPENPGFHKSHATSLEISGMIGDRLKQVFKDNEYILR